MRRTIILGGGTFQPIRNHLSLSAPAFGTTARILQTLIPDSELVLTKMADYKSTLLSNEDVSDYLDKIIEDETIGTIILNIAFCDYKANPINNISSDFHGDRLRTEDGDVNITLTPTEKIIKKIRIKRPDIFLIGFKTTTDKSSDEQFKIALKMMKSVKCNLLLANDTVTRNNFVLTAEETIYGESIDRMSSLKELAEITILRSNLTYNRTDFRKEQSVSIKETPSSFQRVVQFLIDNGGFIENNGNGFTPGHFCFRNSDTTFLSSQRKANHNLVFSEGMTSVEVKDDKFIAFGDRKPSVGARSQWLILEENKDYDCIIHTHNPLLPNSNMSIAEQRPYQCGALECAISTLNNMKYMGDDIKGVYLNKHGANILFKSSSDPEIIINFIKNNIELGVKVR
jgi:hypothetical protein